MLMASLVCLVGLIPLGGSFIRKVESTLSILHPEVLESNSTVGSITELIPGVNTA